MMNNDTKWWTTPPGEDDALLEATKLLVEGSSEWHNRTNREHMTYARLYDRDRLISRPGRSHTVNHPGHDDDDDGVQEATPNIIRRGVDTMLSWILSEQPPLAVRALGARFEDQYAIEEFEAALDAIMNTAETDATHRIVGRDALIGSLGYSMPAYINGEVTVQRLAGWQVMFDPYDARARKPRGVAVVDYMDRADVMNIAEHWDGVTNATLKKVTLQEMRSVTPSVEELMTVYDEELRETGTTQASDFLKVNHHWRVCSAPGRDDGRYVMTVTDGITSLVLVDQKFSHTSVPVCWFLPMPAEEGIIGSSIGCQLIAFQNSIDIAFIKSGMLIKAFGHDRIFVTESEMKESQEKALSAALLTYVPIKNRDNMPQHIQAPSIRQEDINWTEKLMAMADEMLGLNQMMTRGASQLGASASGAALQEEYYRGLDRFSDMAANWYLFRSQIAEQVLNFIDDLQKVDSDFSARYNYMGRQCTKKWSDLTTLRSNCAISVESRGDAALRRGGRIGRLQEWASQGLVDADTAKIGMLTSPDTESAARHSMIPIYLVEWQLRTVIESEDWWDAAPDEDTPLQIAVTRSTSQIQRAKAEGADPAVIERLRAYKAQAVSLLNQMAPPAPGPMMPPGAMSEPGAEILS